MTISSRSVNMLNFVCRDNYVAVNTYDRIIKFFSSTFLLLLYIPQPLNRWEKHKQ